MNARGFSVLEVMVALAVLATVGAVVTSNLTETKTVAKSRFEAERVRDVLLRARNLARFRLKCITVDVQPDHIDLTPYDSCVPGLVGPGATETIAFDNTAITLAAFDTGNPLTFNTLGGTLAAGPSTMTATTAKGKPYQYTVLPAIGTLSMR